jgi:hypothetical protein
MPPEAVPSTVTTSVSQPRPRVLTGRALEHLCKDPITAARLAVDLVYGRAQLSRPIADQAIRLTGARLDDYFVARQALR